MRYFIIISFFLLTINCSQKQETSTYNQRKKINFTAKDIPAPKKLTGLKLSFQEFLNPRHILYLDNHLIIAENSQQESDVFYLYDLEKRTFLKTMGKKGLGPGETMTSSSLEAGFKTGEFWNYDSNRRTINKFKINDDDSSKLATTQIKTPTNLNLVTEVTLTSPSSFIVKTANIWDKLAEINFEGDTLSKLGSWKNMVDKKGLNPFTVSHICQGKLSSSLDKKYVGISGILKDFVEIFDLETGKSIYIEGPVGEDPSFELRKWTAETYPVFHQPSTMHYSQLYLAEDSFFVLYKGETNSKESAPEPHSKIFQFDYEGNFLNNYLLDYPILSFSMDEKEMKIYAITKDEDPNVAVFEL
ncbi:BF3164 family lipoprotein [Echinicola salinicaeni]|uniref:BF3164 family lipoprotein n=1 Tax=Echinicola salinicaeni TaxID=2762757 RepID=UPI001648FD1A|nr:BF3164 family lipoprotein [Echinicola salinicaeni]